MSGMGSTAPGEEPPLKNFREIYAEILGRLKAECPRGNDRSLRAKRDLVAGAG